MGMRPRPVEILAAVSEVTCIDRRSIVQRSRYRHLVHARWLVFWLAHRRFGYPMLRMAQFAGLNHTTVMHGVQQVDAHMVEFAPWLAAVEMLLHRQKEPAILTFVASGSSGLIPVDGALPGPSSPLNAPAPKQRTYRAGEAV